MRANRELTPDQIYWPNVIKPIIGVGRDEKVELGDDDHPDFSMMLQAAMERAEAEARGEVPARVRGLRVGYSR